MVAGTRKAVRYAITDVAAKIDACGLDAAGLRRMRMAEALLRWDTEGVDFVQLREKSLEAGEIFTLARSAMEQLRRQARGAGERPKLLVNGRPDLAAAARADGVHLTAHPGELTPSQARTVFRAAGLPACLVSLSCHTVEQVLAAREGGADLVLFGPVFGKTVRGEQVAEGQGLAMLEAAVAAAQGIPVLALGGVQADTIEACVEAGAAGFAAIRLFEPR